VTDFQRERESLGQWLAGLRREAGRNGTEPAGRLNWHTSKVSRIELGEQTATRNDVAEWARAVNRPEVAAELTARVVAPETHDISHRQVPAQGHTDPQRERAGDESNTSLLRAFEIALVPELLQTPEYARHVLLAMAGLKQLPDDADSAVAARMECQRALRDPRKRFHFVLTTAALRARTCPPDVMRGQLDRLAAATTMDRVRLGIVPDEVQLTVPPIHGFRILDERLVHTEVFATDLNLTDEAQIRLHLRVFHRFASAARYGAQARSILAELALELPRERELEIDPQ